MPHMVKDFSWFACSPGGPGPLAPSPFISSPVFSSQGYSSKDAPFPDAAVFGRELCNLELPGGWQVLTQVHKLSWAPASLQGSREQGKAPSSPPSLPLLPPSFLQPCSHSHGYRLGKAAMVALPWHQSGPRCCCASTGHGVALASPGQKAALEASPEHQGTVGL